MDIHIKEKTGTDCKWTSILPAVQQKKQILTENSRKTTVNR